MAKAGFWLRGARGKLAGASLAKGKNGTVMREIVAPSNPRTTAQLMQRMVFATATRTAKALREIIDHSFEDVKYGQDSVNYFVKQCAKILEQGMNNPVMNGITPYVPALPLGDIVVDGGYAGTIANYLISQGTLPSVPVVLIKSHDADPLSATRMLAVIEAAVPSATITFANLATLGFAAGTQYTFVILDTKPFTKGEFGFRAMRPLCIARINFNTEADAETPIFIANAQTGGFLLNPEVLNLEESTNYDKLLFTTASPAHDDEPAMGWKVDYFDGSVAQDGYCAGTIIASRYESGSWRRSTQQLLNVVETLRDSGEEFAISSRCAWNSLTDLLNDAAGAGSYPSDWYLNKAKNA